jgi:hypothetical protein
MHFHPVTILLEKSIPDAELLTIFVKGLIWLFRFWGVPTLEVTAWGSWKFFKNFLQGLVLEMLPFPMIYNSYIVLHYFTIYSAFLKVCINKDAEFSCIGVLIILFCLK